MQAPLDQPRDLAVPEQGSGTARKVLSQALGRVCRELPGLVRAHASGEGRDDARYVERALAMLSRQGPGAVASVLRRPHVSTLARVLRSAAPGSADGLFTELLALLAFDLAWLGALPCRLTLRRMPSRLVSRTARTVIDVPMGVLGATFENGAMLVERPDRVDRLDLAALANGAPHEWLARPYRMVRDDVALALADNNPLSSIEAHPDKTKPNAVDLGGHGEDEWVASIDHALAVIERHLPGVATDIDVVMQQIVPTGYDSEKHLSCSYQEALGTMYASLHPSLMTMAEAIIHEMSHNKLNALFDLDPVIENGPDELYASPVRPDPRPLRGVLLAVHAFVPIACLYERMMFAEDREVHAGGAPGLRGQLEARLEAIVRANRAGTEILRAHARPTHLGRGLLEELSRWDRHFRAIG